MIDTQNIPVQKIENSRIGQVDFNNIPFGKVYSDHMFVADYADNVWKNLNIKPYAPIEMSPANPSLHYGVSIFEGLKAYKHENGDVAVFRPDKNLERMNFSARRMCMPELDESVYYNGLDTLLSLDKDWVPAAPGTALYLRPFVISDDNYIGVTPSVNFKFMIITCPVGAYYAKPVRVKIETEYVRAVKGGSGACKTGCNYGPTLYPAQLAKAQGYDQLIWTDGREHKYVEESGTMNLMFVINGKLVTPETGDSILNGITRRSVIEVAKSWGMEVEERKVEVAEVVAAIKDGSLQEAFGAGTAATIAHIEVIAHEGTDYTLPDIAKREFSNKVLKELDDIKYGRQEDKFGWLRKI
ncbi:branched-chain amino acid aminotransferase [Fulvivirga maritima]|uniref:branched-chain amino acid aminotransferase n=1 Tax=Fulvivirga maritima TaxID=2904247 RepID=UPI001F189A56|nr:branched-chain amino acid aminotransferase [Fulvivirga maritima]UII29291.1 branched-chain amino acid aminotransferase [Fulvivirga maritima]